jgi:hypothetical protein
MHRCDKKKRHFDGLRRRRAFRVSARIESDITEKAVNAATRP